MVFWEVVGGKVDSQKKLETPHCFLGRFLVGRSTHKKNWKRHMVFWEGSGCGDESEKKLKCFMVFSLFWPRIFLPFMYRCGLLGGASHEEQPTEKN